MRFSHAPEVWAEFPTLVCAALFCGGLSGLRADGLALDTYQRRASERLAEGSEGQFREIRAWRAAFSKMGMKPTQYRCASEALLRRFRKEAGLPRLHPLVDFCNAVSLAYATPIAVFDLDRIVGDLQVRPARGDERYTTFSGEDELPSPGEIIFADADGRAHARRWTNRQSGHSAVRSGTDRALIVAEALHEDAVSDIAALLDDLRSGLLGSGSSPVDAAMLEGPSQAFVVDPESAR